MLCRFFGVSSSGFYAARSRPESRRAQEDRRLKVLLHASYTGGRGYYGSPRIHDDFREWGEHVSRKRIIRLKQEEGLIARVRKRYKVTTDSDHDQPIADNLLQQTSPPTDRISAGSETRANCVLAKTGRPIWPSSWICIPGLSSAGRSARSTIGISQSRRSRWR